MMLSIDDIMTEFNTMMTEQNVVVVSKYHYDLMPIIWTLMSLMYPFEWHLTKLAIVSIDPKNQKDLRF